jgi:hypothetical protein
MAYSDNKLKEKHIMISYQWDSQEMCIRIKNELEKRLNRKVWIDIENMYGDTLDVMEKAVEQASCVLICMSEKYASSRNCHMECKYVIKLSKKFVPLIMQKGYQPTGWYI